MRLRTTSESVNVTRSIANVADRPTVAISTPPTGGPATIPTFIRKEPSALAAASSSGGTSRGSIASSGGRWIPTSPAITAPSTKSTQRRGSGRSAFTSRSAVQTISPASASWTSRRRSTASASAPPTNAATSMGGSSTAASRPSTSVEPVRSYAWNGIATYVSIEPKKERPCPTKRSRKSRRRRSGPMSMAASRASRRQPPGSPTGGTGEIRSPSCGSKPGTAAVWRAASRAHSSPSAVRPQRRGGFQTAPSPSLPPRLQEVLPDLPPDESTGLRQ